MDKTVVILAAGRGSRAGNLTDNQSKCVLDLDRTNPILHTLKSFEDAGVHNAIIITGYQEAGLRAAVNQGVYKLCRDMNVEFIKNDDFDYHGCEYSLSCAASRMKDFDSVIITEGDLIMHPSYVYRLVNDTSSNAALIRPAEYIIDNKSVVGVSDDSSKEYITKYVYDSTHESVLRFIYDKSTIVGDSMQMWKFSGKALQQLISTLEFYKKDADNSKLKEDRPYCHNGLYGINKTISRYPLRAVIIQAAGHWLNINTEKDVECAKKFKWLNRYER